MSWTPHKSVLILISSFCIIVSRNPLNTYSVNSGMALQIETLMSEVDQQQIAETQLSQQVTYEESLWLAGFSCV